MVWALHPGLPPTFAFLGFRFSFSQGLALGVRGFADEHSSGLRDSGTFPPSSWSFKVSGFATHDLVGVWGRPTVGVWCSSMIWSSPTDIVLF